MSKAPKKLATILDEAKRAIKDGCLIPSNHAQERMAERDIDLADVEEAISCGHREPRKDSLTPDKTAWKYAIRAKLSNQKEIRVVVTKLDNGVLLITAIDLNK